jgi:alkylation response protein AidB-like acyl-CoA dehydrogenase
VDLQPTGDQEELRAAAREVLRQACPPAVVRGVFEGGGAAAGVALWKQMGELDWPALTIPVAHGGLGLGFVELALVVEELGRAVAPGPYLPTVTQFVPVVREVGDDDAAGRFLRPVAERGITGTVALAEPGSGRWDPAGVRTVARRAAGGWVLQGAKSWVMEGAAADEIAVVARGEGTAGDEGLGVFVVPAAAVSPRPLPVFDPTQPLAAIELDGVEVGDDRVLAAPGSPGVAEGLARAVQEATVCLAVSTNGTGRAVFERTLQYAKDREQYGRPIGSFQAIKHRLVAMYLALERAAALGAYAAATIAADDGRRALATAMAKAAAGDAQRLLVGDGLQLHGGIGFTWENDLHMFLKRAKSNDLLFGGAATHRAAVARMVGVAA